MMKLYHFTKTDIAIKKILPYMNLKMNYIGNMNDPKENLFHIVNDSDLVEIKGKKFDIDEYLLAEKIRNETRIVSFSTDREVLIENLLTKEDGYKFQRMWANYGQNHEGICLEIDYSKFIEENQKSINDFKIIDKKVVYNRYIPQGLPRRLYGMSIENMVISKPISTSDFWNNLKNNEDFVNYRFFSKNNDWEGESEYRFLSFSKESDEIMLSIKESLSRVIVGINFSKYYIPSLKEIVPQNKIYGIELNNFGEFEIFNLS